MQCFRNFPVAKKFFDKGGDVKTFRRKFSFPHCRKFSYGNHFVQCFINFPVAKKFTDKRGGGYQDSPSKKFSLTVPKNFSGGIFYCFINFRYRKMLGIREGGNTIFRRKNFVSQCRKFCRGTLLFCVSEIFR